MYENDVLADWKNTRFILAPECLLDHEEYLIILTDMTYWNENFKSLEDWCIQNSAKQAGMTVTLNNSKTLTAFCLRWS